MASQSFDHRLWFDYSQRILCCLFLRPEEFELTLLFHGDYSQNITSILWSKPF